MAVGTDSGRRPHSRVSGFVQGLGSRESGLRFSDTGVRVSGSQGLGFRGWGGSGGLV